MVEAEVRHEVAAPEEDRHSSRSETERSGTNTQEVKAIPISNAFRAGYAAGLGQAGRSKRAMRGGARRKSKRGRKSKRASSKLRAKWRANYRRKKR